MTSKGYALARAALIRTLTAYSGITSEDGEVVNSHGTTLVDSNLKGRNDFISEKTILIMSGDAKDEDKGATDFDNSDGKITLQGTGFSAQIKAGTIFRVLNISTIEVDVARIEAKLDTVDTLIDAIKAKTDNLPPDPAIQSLIDALVSPIWTYIQAVRAKTDNLPSDPADQSLIDALVSPIWTYIQAVRAKTDNLPSDPADQSLVDALISPVQTAVAAIKAVTDVLPDGGALTTIIADLEAVLDLAGGASETLVMDGNEQELYKEEVGTTILFFGGINIDWTGLNAGGGEDTTIRAYRKYGAEWRKFYEETFLAATVPDPPVTPAPRNTSTQCVALPIYYKQGIKITAQQAAVGAGWNTLTFDKVTAAPEAA